jgi:hypothetical protein
VSWCVRVLECGCVVSKVCGSDELVLEFCCFIIRDECSLTHSGGALSNVIFMRPAASHVVEISPPWGRHDNHFRNIASVRGVGYERVLQEGDHSEVDVAAVRGAARRLMDGA